MYNAIPLVGLAHTNLAKITSVCVALDISLFVVMRVTGVISCETFLELDSILGGYRY